MRIHLRSAVAFSLLAAAACGNAVAPPSEVVASDREDLTGPAASPSVLAFTPVPTANPKSPGLTSINVVPPEFFETVVVQGSVPVENPASVTLSDGTVATVPFYGYDGDGPLMPLAGDLPSDTHKVEATKTEPDKNTYLVLPHQTGPDASYDYGDHFIFQGHESGQSGVITRVNLDADYAHQVTIMASTMKDGTPLPFIDGSTWDPFARKLVFTTESADDESVVQASPEFPSVVEPLAGAIGHGAYEGVQNDEDGNLWLVEDAGGATSATFPHSKQPNSFVYRFVPNHPRDLTRGKLQALQIVSLRTGQPIAFHDGQAAADASSPDMADLHTYGKVFRARWVTLHDTSVDGTAPFNANSAAKAKLATPFKRPENGAFRPGKHFTEFYFDETGDTDLRSEVGAAFGGFGSIFRLELPRASADQGTLSLFYLCDAAHMGLDNVNFLTRDQVVFVEDAGDTAHAQRNALDSAYAFDVRVNYANGAQPPRFFAEGRDPAATVDSSLGDFPGFQNEGDNEITGFHVSNGDPTADGLLGASSPTPFSSGWRVFYTAQHGNNALWEILPKARH